MLSSERLPSRAGRDCSSFFGDSGAERVRKNEPQLDCQLVQAMVTENLKAAKIAKADFADRAKDEASNYYAEDPDDPDEDSKWYVRDLDDESAPHVPVAISYQPWLAHFDDIDEIRRQAN